VLKKAFSSFGDVRMVDIPMLDPYRHKMNSSVSGIRTFSFGEDLVFQAYVQFKEYIGFVKCMNALKGMKLCYTDRDTVKAWTANIKVDFDKSKHLAESSIKARKAEREKLVKEEVDKLESEKKKARLQELQRNEQIKLLEAEERDQDEKKKAKKLVAEQRRLAREEKRKKMRLKKMGLTEEEEMAYRIGAEERKLILAQRKLESIRVLDELISRVKGVGKINLGLKAKLESKEKEKSDKEESDDEVLKAKEKKIRDKLVLKLKKKDDPKLESHSKLRRSKTEGFESVSGEDSDSSRGGKIPLEKITDDELSEGSDEDEESEIGSDDELRLTSTDDGEGDTSEDDNKKLRKNKKKGRKEKEKEREREKVKEREKKEKKNKRDRDGKKSREDEKKREIEREVRKAQRIAKKRSPERDEAKVDLWEHEKYDRDRSGRDCRDRDRERTPTGYYGVRDYYERRKRSSSREDDYVDDRERDNRERKKFVGAAKMRRVNQFLRQQGMRKEEVEREMERAYEQYFSSLAKKDGARGLPKLPTASQSYDNSKEEEWERMMNPHNFDQDTGRKGYRKPVLSQHYEDFQKEQLQAEIRIRERREREGHGRRSDRRDRSASPTRNRGPGSRRSRRSRSRSRGRRERY